MDNIFYIYTLINPVNRQVFYVGMSKHPHNRYICHLSEAKKRKYIRHKYIYSLSLFGIKPEMKIIEKATLENWKERECFFIDYYKSIGYKLVNVAPGGGAFPNWEGKHHTEETKLKISIANKGKLRPSTKPRKKRTPQTTPRWDKGVIGRNGNKVYKYDLDGNYICSYNSTNHAGIDNNISQSTIVRCCNNNIHRAKNFIFRYEYKNKIEPFNYVHKIKIDCYTNDNVFVKQYNSLLEAGAEIKTSPCNISAMLNNKQKTAGGYIWKYS